MINQFAVSVRKEAGYAVIETDGYINNLGGEKIGEAAFALLKEGYKKLAINLEKSTVINSIGISILIEVIEKVEEIEGALAFYGLTRTIAKTFTIMGLAQFATLANSEEEAIAALG